MIESTNHSHSFFFRDQQQQQQIDRLIDKHTASSNRHSSNMTRGGSISRGWSPRITSIILFILLHFTATTFIVTSTSLAHLTQRVHDKPTNAESKFSQVLKANESVKNYEREPSQFDARSYGPLSNQTKDNLEQPRKPLIDLIDKRKRGTRNSDLFAESIKDSGGKEQRVAAINHEQASALTNSTQITSSMTSALISATTAAPVNMTEYATVNYNGVIGFNATDPFAIATESRSFGLPIEIQILMCFLYGTLAFTAVTSNLTVCYIVLSNQRMRTATNYFIVNLAVGDILMALLCIPFTFPANLIFQYWPFGLSLCVIVSYSQANSVFISAYTMVAISIDKYIAIMYPMRLRMPKNQAKMIILVIWSAALITSLPTALLSSLTLATPDLGPSQPSTTPSSFVEITTPSSVYTNPSIVTNPASGSASTEQYRISSQAGDNITLRDERKELLLARSSSGSRNSFGANISSDTTTPISASPTRQEQSQQQTNQDYEEQRKYFCQESWLVWPGGKYYYSMALMILQFVVPLFVLVVTYTRIVIVVWGKRVPGEEDNARDARMARSKRKMIRMVIFCVIAFALTWLPFNALIVIGDMHPDIWENQNIMYIWFITHYLAMCHTITNPLIYIWMNNRFRAGFTQVVGDACRFLHRLFAYLLCHCLCMGCCLDCSRQKYARVEQNINRKRTRRGPLASSGSIQAYNHHNNNGKSGTTSNQHPHHHYNTQTTTGGGGAGGFGGHKTPSSNDYCTKVANSGQIMAANNGSTHLDRNTPGYGSTTIFIKNASGDNEPAPSSEPVASTSGGANGESPEERSLRTRTAGRAIRTGSGLQSNHAHESQGDLIAPGQTLTTASSNDIGSRGDVSSSVRRSTQQARLSRRSKATGDKSDTGGCRRYSVSRSWHQQHSASSPTPICDSDSDADLTPVDQRQRRSQRDPIATDLGTVRHQSSAMSQRTKRKKRRRKHSHGVSLHMTQPYRPSGCPQVGAASTAHKHSCTVGSTNAAAVADHKPPTTSKWRAMVGVRRSKSKQQQSGPSYSAECPSCQSSCSGLLGLAKSRAARKASADAHVRFQNFMYEFRDSSQSTATVSAQTNNTSLAITPLSFTTGGGPNRESANTSASLSPNGLGSAASGQNGTLHSYSAQRLAGRESSGDHARDNSITVIRSEQANGTLASEPGAQLNRSSRAVKFVARAEPYDWEGASKTTPLAVDGATTHGNGLKLVHCDVLESGGTIDAGEQIEHSIGSHDESVAVSPLECAAYRARQREINVGEQQRQEHLPHRRQSVEVGAIGGDRRLHVNEIGAQHHPPTHNHHTDSGGTLSEATSLEGHQLASSTSASESCNQSDPAQSRRQNSSDESAVQPSRLKFCPEHRQTASAAEVNPRGHHCDHRRFTVITARDHRELSFPSTRTTGKDVVTSNESDADPLDDEHRHHMRHATATFCSPLNEIGAQVGEQREFTCPGRKSSSAFELVSEHLLHVRHLPCAGKLIQEQQQQQQQHQARAILDPSHYQHMCNDHVDERGYLHLNGDRKSLTSNDDDEDDGDDDSSLEAEYGEIQRDLGSSFAGDFEPAESIQLRPLTATQRKDKRTAARQVRQRNRLFSSTSDGLCSTHSHDDNRWPNVDYDLTHDSRTSGRALATCIPLANSARDVLVGFHTSDTGQRGASNKMDHGSTVINFCDIPNKAQPGMDFHDVKMARKTSLHYSGGGNQQHTYQPNHHRQQTKSMSPIHLGRQGNLFVAAATTDNAMDPNGARNF